MSQAPVRAVAISGSDQALRTTYGVYFGYTFVETGGSSTATVRLYDNASAASGTLIGAVNLAAGGSADLSLNHGQWVENGIFVDVGGSGTVAGSIRIG